MDCRSEENISSSSGTMKASASQIIEPLMVVLLMVARYKAPGSILWPGISGTVQSMKRLLLTALVATLGLSPQMVHNPIPHQAFTEAESSNMVTVGMAVTKDGGGYWEVTANGQVFAYGDATNYGGVSNLTLNAPIVGMAADSMTGGYWLVAADGGIFAFNAPFYGSMGGKPLNKPVVGMAADPQTGGYWEVASDGGIFAFNAPFYGSMGGKPLNKPVVGMAASPNGSGYWLDASDGGIFAFNAPFYGSTGGITLTAPMVGMATDPTNGGYWLVGDDGAVIACGAPFYGSEVLSPTSDPSSNIMPSAAMDQYCFSATTAIQCDQASLAQIDVALLSESYGPLVLPSDFEQLSPVQQVVAVANAERQVRGLPVEPENSQWDDLAYQGAVAGTDPTGPPYASWGSNLASGFLRPLEADFVWMYDDGPGSNNIACTPSNPSGCWGHRNNILNNLAPAQMGAAEYPISDGLFNFTELFVAN